MKSNTIKWILAALTMIIILLIALPIFAADDELLIYKNSEKEYLIYLKGNLKNEFEFAFSNNKDSKKDELLFYQSAKDTDDDEANTIVYIDEELYDNYFAKNTYLWVRTNDGKYIIEAKLLNIKNAISENDIENANSITKRVSVDTTQVYEKPEENVDGVKVTKTVGKIVVKEKGKNFYQIVKVTENEDYAEFAKIIKDIVDGKASNEFYNKLETANTLVSLYNKLLQDVKNKNWKEASNNEILQPEEAKENDEYIIWIKNENNGLVKQDVQLLTSFEDYKPEVISEKVVSKLPVTADDPTLFIILAFLVLSIVIVIIAKIIVSKKEKMGD